jgi:glycosyltransferase involved in cell wall biosynthesis
LARVDEARRRTSSDVEVVVVANRCRDSTADIALSAGATVVESPVRNIAAVRNTGVAASSGAIVVTVDADSQVHPNTFAAIERELGSGTVVGGGAAFLPERTSPGIATTLALTRAIAAATRTAGVMYWCARTDFDAVGGFDESLTIGEDVDFSRRLRRHGRRTRRRFVTLRDAPVVISTRKFDRFGDWHMLTMIGQLPAIARARRGEDTAWADRYFFDFNDSIDDT